MLRTYETKPQVIMHVDGLPAVCHNLTCDFTYTIPHGEVTGFAYNLNTKELYLVGIDLPLNLSSIRHVEFAHSLCSIDESSLNGTELRCILDHDPVCGSHLPKLVARLGLVSNNETLVPLTINCTVYDAYPTT